LKLSSKDRLKSLGKHQAVNANAFRGRGEN
jgi:hypothetical protein